MRRLLFVLKFRDSDCYNTGSWSYGCGLSSGLYNSAKFVVDMLNASGDVQAKLVQVIDNNRIDREIAAYQPTDVIIEAYWVVPEKFVVLQKLHPKVNFIVRTHSKTAFLANEGIAFEWTKKYLQIGVDVAPNSDAGVSDMNVIRPADSKGSIIYLPNYYPHVDSENFKAKKALGMIDVGCFGAIRPLKNQLSQAIAAIHYANDANVELNFHMNNTRIETGGNPVLKNIISLFENSKHKLFLHEWIPQSEFLKLIARMDLSMQVSFSETFNIVTADAISQGVPVVVSNEIPYLSETFQSGLDASQICKAVKKSLNHFAWNKEILLSEQASELNKYCKSSRKVWLKRFAM